MLQQYLSKYSTIEEQQQALEQLAVDHPYFAPAQFHLLLQKKENESGYEQLAARNAILFNNPLWLSFQLDQFQTKEYAVDTTEAEIVDTADLHKELDPNQHVEIVDRGLETFAVVEEKAPDEQTASILVPTINTEEHAAETADEQEANNTGEVTEKAEAVDEFYKEMEPAYPLHEVKDESLQNTTPLLKDILIQDSSDTSDELPAFQPLYTSDYFASQGIKLSEEITPNDKLGKQMRSFTEWLKTMKKVHPEKVLVAEETNVSVQVQAEKSNADDDVITEAMAEVFVLQGKPAKAIEIYEKLSLLNPAKSVFFAAKIEQLKRN